MHPTPYARERAGLYAMARGRPGTVRAHARTMPSCTLHLTPQSACTLYPTPQPERGSQEELLIRGFGFVCMLSVRQAAPPHPPDALSLTAQGRTQPADDNAGGSPRSGERQEEGAARKSPRAGDPAAYFAVPARSVRASFRPDSMYLPPPTALERLAGPLAPLVAGLGAVLGFIFF